MKKRYHLMWIGLSLVSGFVTAAVREADQEVVIEPVGNELRFATEEVTARAGTRLKLVLNNTATSPVMYHNIVVLRVDPEDSATIDEVGFASIEAGDAREYVPDHKAILAYTSLAAPGERAEVVFTVPPPGDYSFICSYLGHFVTMRGVLHSVQ